jgi:Ni,Fe-hydrogenase III large subunit
MNHAEMTFMSMIEATKDLARSGDGLAMDWIDVPFGPFFPGLPGGLLLTLTLDGDTVAAASVRTLIDNVEFLQQPAPDPQNFVEQLTGMEPQTPLAYRFLACRAIENAAGIEVFADTARARVGILERERIASHLGWLALFGQQIGFDRLQRRAVSLQQKFRLADREQSLALAADIDILIRRLHRTPLLKCRIAGIGRLEPGTVLRGPVARAAGIDNDARSTDPTYVALGFRTVSLDTSDILARLHIRLDEIIHSLALIEAAGAVASPVLTDIGKISGTGEAVVETPRGMASLQVTLDKGKVIAARLDTPSTGHLTVVDAITAQQALGDALLAVGSLDLSPWEIRQ